MQKKIAIVIGLALTAALLAAAATAQDKPHSPVGFINFKVTSIGIGIGATWCSGTFNYSPGGTYPIKVGGVDLANVGVSELEGEGSVYNLTNPEDIYGTYNKASAGIAILGGGKGTVMKNAKGVVIDVSATQKGVAVNLGIGSLEISRPEAKSFHHAVRGGGASFSPLSCLSGNGNRKLIENLQVRKLSMNSWYC